MFVGLSPIKKVYQKQFTPSGAPMNPSSKYGANGHGRFQRNREQGCYIDTKSI